MLKKPRLALSILLPLIAGVMCCHLVAQENLPLDRRDGLPTGERSPEAAACDMVRALVGRDFQSFSLARPEGGGGVDTPNDVVNHYVALVTDTAFRSDGGVVTAHEILKGSRLTVKRASLPVEIERDLLRPYEAWAFGAYKQHSYVDVTVSDRDGTEFTTRMIVVYVESQGLWKAYPIGLEIDPLYQKLNILVAADDRHRETRKSAK